MFDQNELPPPPKHWSEYRDEGCGAPARRRSLRPVDSGMGHLIERKPDWAGLTFETAEWFVPLLITFAAYVLAAWLKA